AWNRRAAVLPFEPAGNHQVEHQEQVAVEAEHDSLTQAAQPEDAAALEFARRRFDGSDDEGVPQAEAIETRPRGARDERLEVGSDVRQLRHGSSVYLTGRLPMAP